jgi:hypothetical protein
MQVNYIIAWMSGGMLGSKNIISQMQVTGCYEITTTNGF